MPYDVFQSRGPAIPISLFGDATSQGIAAGNAQKTKTQAIVEGVTSGIQTGQQIVANEQVRELNQNKIDQLPVTNAIQQQQLEQQQAQTELDQLNLQLRKNTEDLVLQQTKNELALKVDQSTQALNSLKFKDTADKIISGNDPTKKTELLKSEEFSKLVISNPQEGERLIGRLYQGSTPEERDYAQALLSFSKQHAFDQAQENINEKGKALVLRNAGVSTDKFLNDPQFQEVIAGMNPTDIAKNIKLVPRTEAVFDEQGRLLPQKKEGTIEDKDRNYYHVVVNGFNSGVEVDKGAAGRYYAFVSSQKYLDQQNAQANLGVNTNVPGKPAARSTTRSTATTVPTLDSSQGSSPPPTYSSPESQAIIEQSRKTFEQSKLGARPSGLGPKSAQDNYEKQKLAYRQKFGNLMQRVQPNPAPAAGTPASVQEQVTPEATPNAPQTPAPETPGPITVAPGQNEGPAPIPAITAVPEFTPEAPGETPTPAPTVTRGATPAPETTPEGTKFTPEVPPTPGAQAESTPQVQVAKQVAAPVTYAPEPMVTHGPNESLSRVLKQPVSLDLSVPVQRLRPTTVNIVNSEPLLVNEPPLFKGLAAVESHDKGRAAVSPTGVRGLLQVTQRTAAIYGLNRDIPEQNVLAGKLYLMDQLNDYHGNLYLALAAYNVGPGVINDALRETGSADWNHIKAYLKHTISADKFKETSVYPDRVIAAASQFVGNGNDGDQGFISLLQYNGLLRSAKGQVAA